MEQPGSAAEVGKPSTATTEAQIVGCPRLFPTQASDVGELAICSTELVQRAPRLIDLDCDDFSSAVDHADTTEAVIAAMKLPAFCCLWYFFNVQYNIQNKLLLEVFPAVLAVSFIQLLCGTLIALFMWASGILQTPKVSAHDLATLAPVGAVFAAGQVTTVASLAAVSVSFTHVVKALEPVVNAIASAFMLGKVFHPTLYASLIPIVLGVALASASEVTFSMFGFLMAMASNFFYVARNVLSTKFVSAGDMGKEKTTRKTHQLAVLNIVATVALLPVAMMFPGGLWSVSRAWQVAVASGVPARELAVRLLASGFYYFMFQVSSFWVLSCVEPITHSVLNTLKRVVVIVVSIAVFHNPVTQQGMFGTFTAISGVLLYSLLKSHYSGEQKQQAVAGALDLERQEI